MKKYLLSIICTLLPIFASAQEPYAIMIDDNTAIEFRYDNEKAARGGMDIGPFSSAEERPWHSLAEGIISVIINESFANYTGLTSTAYWFSDFFHVDYIGGLEYLKTSNVTDMTSMFLGCKELSELDVSHFNTSSVTNMSFMFASCVNLQHLDVTNFNTEHVTNMSYMFDDCIALVELDLSSFYTRNVTNMRSMFYNCNALTTIYVHEEKWSTVYVDNGDEMFERCENLVGGMGTTWSSSHIGLDYAHIDFGSEAPGYLTDRSGGGSGEEGQYWMELQSTLQYANDVYSRSQGNANVEPWMQEELYYQMERGNEMYNLREADEEEVRHMIEELNWICWEIEEAMNRNPDEPSGEAEPYAVLSDNGTVLTFYYDNNKTSRNGMNVGPFSWIRSEWKDDREWYDSRASITTVIFDSSFAQCTTLTSTAYWFDGCINLSTITGIENLKTSNVTNMENMFGGEILLNDNGFSDQRGCRSLTEIDLSHFDTSNVTNMQMMFRGCSGLLVLDVSGFNTLKVTNMSCMFDGCSNLTSLDVSNFNTSNVTDMSYMFDSCSGLTNLDLREFDTSKLTDMSYMFFGCSNLVNLNVSNFNTSNVIHMNDLFRSCSNLVSIDISSFDTSSVIWMSCMFLSCSKLTTIYVSDSWNTAAVTDGGKGMFYDCTNLIGGRGTQWDPDHTDAAYAHVDGGANNPGYLTDKNAEPVESEAWFDGLTAWVYGDATLDDAFAEVGREEALKTIAAIVWEGNGALTSEQMQGITNPNLLVYVNEASKAPAGVQNIIVNGTAAQIVLTDASGNNNFHCPQSFSAQSISYTRNFSQTTEIGVSRGWETIALPFNVQGIFHELHGALVPFGGGNGGYPIWLHQLQGDGLTPVTAIEANTPYLICMPNNKVYPSAYNQVGNVTFVSSNVTVPETHPHEGSGAGVMLIPAFQNQDASPDIYTLNVGEARDSYAEGSVFISNYRSVRPFQAYAVHTSQARGEDSRYIPLTSIGGGDGDTTGIMEIENGKLNIESWYSLDGRRLNAKPTKKGVYIQNGKKVVVK